MKTREQIEAMALVAAEAVFNLTYESELVGKASGTLRAAIAAYEAALWRPISDAPRDGTVILAIYETKNLQKTTWWTNHNNWEQWRGVSPTRFRYLPASQVSP